MQPKLLLLPIKSAISDPGIPRAMKEYWKGEGGERGRAQKTDLIYRDQEICNALKSDLKEKNLFLVGIDIIGNYLTEINVTSPTGLKQINELDHVCLEKVYWDKIEKKFF